MSSHDLTGRWLGHYVQWGHERPISAELLQVGETLTGSMCDGHTDREVSVFEAAAEAGLPPGTDEQIEAKLREMTPDASTARIRYVSHLPSDAVLDGELIGQTVSFVKTYQGETFDGYRVGDQWIGLAKPGHCVHYKGRLSPDGNTIEGRWWIDAEPEIGSRRTEGEFLLRREG